MVVLLAVFLLLDSLFYSGTSVKEIPYSSFRDLIREDKVQSVVIEKDKIYGLLKANDAPSSKDASKEEPPIVTPKRNRTPWSLSLGKTGQESQGEKGVIRTVLLVYGRL